jgi:hypothetical protein
LEAVHRIAPALMSLPQARHGDPKVPTEPLFAEVAPVCTLRQAVTRPDAFVTQISSPGVAPVICPCQPSEQLKRCTVAAPALTGFTGWVQASGSKDVVLGAAVAATVVPSRLAATMPARANDFAKPYRR